MLAIPCTYEWHHFNITNAFNFLFTQNTLPLCISEKKIQYPLLDVKTELQRVK